MAGFTTPLLLSFVAAVLGHGALVHPLPRNAIDRVLPRDKRTPVHDGSACTNLTGGAEGCDIGQAQYWYNQGCFIGCPECDSVSGRRQVDVCGLGKQPTVNDPGHRSVNRGAPAGSDLDIYKHNPWRAPGAAPVIDACGLAGGTPWGDNVSEWGDFVATPYAKHGDRGSQVLPALPNGVRWEVGGEVEAVWQIGANHGGGYSYRLCPASEALTEECFQKHPLEFVKGKQALIFPNGTRLPVGGTFVSDGTTPLGSMWALNPIPPRCLGGANFSNETNFCHTGNVYPNCSPCPGTPGSDCTTCDNSPEPSFEPPCTESAVNTSVDYQVCSGNQGHGMGGVNKNPVAVVDTLRIPAALKAGAYVLGWRLDCEATAQIWTNCADIQIV